MSGSNINVRVLNMSDYNKCTRTREFHVLTRPAKNAPWNRRAIVFNYQDALTFARTLKTVAQSK